MMQSCVVLIEQYLFINALNLMPIPPLGGSKAWLLLGLLILRRMDQQKARKRQNARRDTIEKLRTRDVVDASLQNVQSDVDEILRRAAANSRDETGTRRK